MSDPVLRMARVFEAPVSRVFAAWIDPKDLEKWAWGDLGVNVRAEVDSRVGGRYRIETSRPDHETWAFSGTYVEIIPTYPDGLYDSWIGGTERKQL